MLSILNKYKNTLIVIGICLAVASRFAFLNFGLPYVFQADEVEMVEYSLKYAVNLNKFIQGDFYFFKPFSFVYGSLPAYLNTILLVPFLKITSALSLSQDRFYIYLYLRSIYAVFSVLTCIGVYYLAKQLTKNTKIQLLATLLFSLNFYFYWLSKYLNNDVLVALFTVFFLIFYLRFKETNSNKDFFLAMLFIGFGIGTKITFGITLIYPLIDLIIKKEYRKIITMSIVVFLIYLVTNPFSFLFFNEFYQRIMEMRVKENGIVIDSYNTSLLKYVYSLFNNITIPITIFSLFYLTQKIRERKIDITIFISVIYILFFSASSRLVDRWLLPIYPLLILYGLLFLEELKSKKIKFFVLTIVIVEVLFKFCVANYELGKNSNLLNAFNYFKNGYSNEFKNVYVITERGLNPFNSLKRTNLGIDSQQFVPYVSEGAFSIPPADVTKYDYIVYSSKVRSYYLNPYIKSINPQYVATWESSYQLLNSDKFEILATFETGFTSLLGQENIIIFKKK